MTTTNFRGILRVLGAPAAMQGGNVLLFVPSCITHTGYCKFFEAVVQVVRSTKSCMFA
jgi:hypothetical protein